MCVLGLLLAVGQRPASLWAEETRKPDNQSAPAAAAKVDFATQVRPIFVAFCQKCHGSEKRSGGLRLDLSTFAEMGGDSGKPILGGTLETNELYLRVASNDRSYRMPKNAAALSDQQIELIRQWVEQGTPWPDESRPSGQRKAFYENWIESIGRTLDDWSNEMDYARPYALAFVLFQVALLIIARARTAYHNNRPWAIGRGRWLGRPSSAISPREMTLAWLLSFAVMGIVLMRGHQLKTTAQLARAQGTLVSQQSHWRKTIYGFPPKPIRPDHPKQVSGTYYRGNCERNAELFNNGNYLTATFRVGLFNARHEPVDVGDAASATDLFVRIEIERAPGASEALFSDELMSSVFLVSTFYDTSPRAIEVPPVRLKVVEAGQHWDAYFKLATPENAAHLEGLIYMYAGRLNDDGTAHGEPHFGIQYDLILEDGKLSDKSDLWMNSFGNSVFADPQPAAKLPYREWFDYRPMPVITGENSKDPKLLGVDEYVKKGLIKPSEPAPSQKVPPSDQPQKEESLE